MKMTNQKTNNTLLSGCLTVTLLLGLAPLSGAQTSASLPTDRARVTVATNTVNAVDLKVIRSDQNTPLRAGTTWVYQGAALDPNSYYETMRASGLNAVRMVLRDTFNKPGIPAD